MLSVSVWIISSNSSAVEKPLDHPTAIRLEKSTLPYAGFNRIRFQESFSTTPARPIGTAGTVPLAALEATTVAFTRQTRGHRLYSRLEGCRIEEGRMDRLFLTPLYDDLVEEVALISPVRCPSVPLRAPS